MDVDIDFYDRNQILDIIDHIPAAMVEKNVYKKHNTGVYTQNIPTNPLTGLSSLDYKTAENRGYFKIDFLNVGAYKGVRDEQHLIELMNRAPLWELLEQEDFTDLLFHVNGHTSTLKVMKPKSIDQLAAILAMIRPAKRHLIGQDWDTVMNDVWSRSTDTEGYSFKKSHAYAYAMVVIVQMNLICEGINHLD